MRARSSSVRPSLDASRFDNAWILLPLMLLACGSPESSAPDVQRADALILADTRAPDTASPDSDDTTTHPIDAPTPRDTPPDGDDDLDGAALDTEETRDIPAAPCLPPQAPTERLWPAPGEVFYAQLGLGGFSLGEAAVVIGPDGTIVLIDAGNDSHDDDVQAALATLVGRFDGAGLPPHASDSVDHVVITHLHADHSDGLQDLLANVTVAGRVVHRGFLDLTPAANEATVEQLCDTLRARPGLERALCEGDPPASCDPATWTGQHSSSGCSGLDAGDLSLDAGSGPAFLSLGGDATLDILAVNGWVNNQHYASEHGPLLQDDSNGENARSVVGMIRHGDFRLLFNGDLTGGGSDTDPVEAFYAERLPLLGPRGVDVLHAGHHGRNTSSSTAWMDRLTPSDGRARNVVMGISDAHLGSPHSEVLDVVLGAGRLGEGRAWATTIATGGADASGLVDAGGGWVIVRTLEGGASYAVQAISDGGDVIESRAFRAVEGCPEEP